MRIIRIACLIVFFSFAAGVCLHAAPLTGLVTNKTTNKPSSGDSVVLVDVQAGMSEAAKTTTDSAGQYTLDAPGMGPYLIRVTHQGGSYFIAAPQGSAPGNINVYDVAAKVDGVSIDADMFLLEAAGDTLRVHQRILVRNTSLPPRAQFSDNTFEVNIPEDAEIDSASATRPGGLGTNTRLVPLVQKGHYTFNVPIQPDQGENETLFEVQFHLPYNGRYTFRPQLPMAADNLVIYAAKGIEFTNPQGARFQPVQQDPRVQTFVTKNVRSGQGISFSISGEGQMPQDAQGSGMGQPAGMGGGDPGASGVSATPGGGIGAPIDSPDPLTQYKWWILGLLSLLLVSAAAFFLQRRYESAAMEPPATGSLPIALRSPEPMPASNSRPRLMAMRDVPLAQVNSREIILQLLKDEMFALESERLSGSLPQEEYASIKIGLDALLQRQIGAGQITKSD